MKHRDQSRKHLSSHKRFLIRLFAITYLLFFIVSQAVAPTTAYFTDTTTKDGSISIASTFDATDEKQGIEEELDDGSDEETETDNEVQESETNSEENQQEQLDKEKEEKDSAVSEPEKQEKQQVEENEKVSDEKSDEQQADPEDKEADSGDEAES